MIGDRRPPIPSNVRWRGPVRHRLGTVKAPWVERKPHSMMHPKLVVEQPTR